jgi:hypothetical protein
MVCRFSDNIFTGSEQDMVSDKVNRSQIKYAMSCTLVTELLDNLYNSGKYTESQTRFSGSWKL